MNNKIQVRRYQDGDAKFLSQIYYNTIHTVNAMLKITLKNSLMLGLHGLQYKTIVGGKKN